MVACSIVPGGGLDYKWPAIRSGNYRNYWPSQRLFAEQEAKERIVAWLILHCSLVGFSALGSVSVAILYVQNQFYILKYINISI